MRFERRSYYKLPHQYLRPTPGKVSLYLHDLDGTTTYITDDRSSSDVYHLRFAGTQTIALAHSNPGRGRPGASIRCFTAYRELRNYMVNIIRREDLLSDTAIFVSDGRQTIPLLLRKFVIVTEIELFLFHSTKKSRFFFFLAHLAIGRRCLQQHTATNRKQFIITLGALTEEYCL